MRLYSPVPLVARKHSSPIIIDGIEVPVGPRVDINITALHHNNSVWDSFKTFDPERFIGHSDHEVYSYVPFSAGSRNCIGQQFALNEIKITIAKLVKRYKVSIEGLEDPVFLPDVVLRSSTGIKIKLARRE